jgi:hypothetical protein
MSSIFLDSNPNARDDHEPCSDYLGFNSVSQFGADHNIRSFIVAFKTAPPSLHIQSFSGHLAHDFPAAAGQANAGRGRATRYPWSAARVESTAMQAAA